MITSIKKAGESSYLINDCVKITINEDISVTAEFNDEEMTADEVNALIDELFESILEKHS